MNADTTARAVQEVVNAQIIIEFVKQVMPVGNLCELALKLETRNLAGGLDSPFREMERDRVIREAGRILPAITPFAPTGEMR